MRSLLHAQQVDDVDLGQHGVEVVAHLRPASPSRLGGSSVGGATSVTSAPSAVKASTSERATRQCLMSPTIAMCSPSSDAEVLADRVAVEQRLGGVLVPAVAGVDHRRVDPAGDLPRARRPSAWRTTIASTPIASIVCDGVAQGLALLHRRRADA